MFNLKNLITNRDYYNRLRREVDTLRTVNQDQASRIIELAMDNKDLETKLALCDIEITSMREMIAEDEKKISGLEADLKYLRIKFKKYTDGWDKSLSKQVELEDKLSHKCYQLKYTRLVGCIFMLITIIQSLRILHIFNF